MKDPRCIVGWHDFAQPPASDRITDDGPGLRVECTRCNKSKVIKNANPPFTGGGPLRMGVENEWVDKEIHRLDHRGHVD